MNTPSFKEDHISQIPALQLLINLGYTYLTPEEALTARGGKTSNVILETILEKNNCVASRPPELFLINWCRSRELNPEDLTVTAL